MIPREEMFHSPRTHMWVTLLATAQVYLKRVSAYVIELVRWPLGPLMLFAIWRITYGVSGRHQVDGATISGFLVVGIFGVVAWTSTIWASGYAIEFERQEGTSAALFMSPASRAAVVAGYGLGSFIWLLPSFIGLVILALATGARLHVTSPALVVAAALSLVISSLSVGFALSGLFILSRRANLIANFMQQPVYLLSGFVIPLTSLPSGFRAVSEVLPATHAVTALRQSALLGGSAGEAGKQVLLALVCSGAFWVVGIIAIRRVEHVAKRSGQLELY